MTHQGALGHTDLLDDAKPPTLSSRRQPDWGRCLLTRRGRTSSSIVTTEVALLSDGESTANVKSEVLG